jgi:hypothetical protein
MSCELTYDRDKLVALSGLVSELQSIMDDKYLAGLWKRNMVKDLVWWVEDTKQRTWRRHTDLDPTGVSRIELMSFDVKFA